ncbi:hypothetical protein LTR95_006991 [Oleoguttula sp. CCFEE 5521]
MSVNESILERFKPAKGKNKITRAEQKPNQIQLWIQEPKLNPRVRQYFEPVIKPQDAGAWLERLEIPAPAELLELNPDGTNASDTVEVVPNKPVGAWSSKEAYLGAHYELLREDAIQPLRKAVLAFRTEPEQFEEFFGNTLGIYQNVHVVGLVCSTRDIALRVTFSTFRAQKRIIWEQSKRLITGSLVVLSTKADRFKSKLIVATVASRALARITQNPPELDLFIAHTDDIEFDPAANFIMLEERSGYYEANKHTLLALQKIRTETFPLAEHLVAATPEVSTTAYINRQPVLDLTSVFVNDSHVSYEKTDVLHQWPVQPQCDLDASQIMALRRTLTKKLAIVQGPPGTGKTYVSVQALKVMLANWASGDPPIIIACQTNHALDQLLNHVAPFCPELARLGGRSKDRNYIKSRTMYELRQAESNNKLPGSAGNGTRQAMARLEKEIAALLLPLKPDNEAVLDHDLLASLGLLTDHQVKSLIDGASQWVQAKQSNPNHAARSPLMVWLGDALEPVLPPGQPEEYGFELEEADLEYEQLKDIEAEGAAKDDAEVDTLYGNSYSLADNFTGRKNVVSTRKISAYLHRQDLWQIPEAARGAVYRHLQKETKDKVRDSIRPLAKQYNTQARLRQIGTWERDETILRNQKVIGVTTTGLSKYRGLIAALQPRVVLIEEAAETLEAPVIAACVPSLQQLILVGDHKQLRPHCHVKQHENKPYYLNVSLFERMVNNNVEFDTLVKQRRMIPEIRRLLYPIYGDLIKDHDSVRNPALRPDVPGMGGVNSYFFTHQWPEKRDDLMSCVNSDEGDMIVGFVEYLVYNGMKTENITVLTFYNGQRKYILSALRKSLILQGRQFNIVTVDSYQGEENDIVILSLVRSNDKGQVGFLSNDNRVCVALSRAKRGFYLFGNGMLLFKSKTWAQVLTMLAGQHKKCKTDRPKIEPSRLNEQLPIRCSNHNNLTNIKDANDWDGIAGGCTVPCKQKLPCGHACTLNCHPFSHDLVPCQQICSRKLACGHNCTAPCASPCVCKICTKTRRGTPPQSSTAVVPFDGIQRLAPQLSSGSSNSWKSFAHDESARYAAIVSEPVSLRSSPKKNEDDVLVDDGSGEEEKLKKVSTGLQQLALGLDGTTSAPMSLCSGSSGEGSRTVTAGKGQAMMVEGVGPSMGMGISGYGKMPGGFVEGECLLD